MKREMKLNSVVKIGTWSEREKSKVVLGEQTFPRQTRVVARRG